MEKTLLSCLLMFMLSLCFAPQAQAVIAVQPQTKAIAQKQEQGSTWKRFTQRVKKAARSLNEVFRSRYFVLGVLLFLGGLLVTILLSSLLNWIGTVAMIVGLGLMIWAFIKHF